MNTKSRPITVDGIKYRWLQTKTYCNPRIIIFLPDGSSIFVPYSELPDGPMYGRQVSPRVVGDYIRANIKEKT